MKTSLLKPGTYAMVCTVGPLCHAKPRRGGRAHITRRFWRALPTTLLACTSHKRGRTDELLRSSSPMPSGFRATHTPLTSGTADHHRDAFTFRTSDRGDSR